jgi:hypothetical protein
MCSSPEEQVVHGALFHPDRQLGDEGGPHQLVVALQPLWIEGAQRDSALDTAAMVMAVMAITALRVALYLMVIGLEHVFVTANARVQ